MNIAVWSRWASGLQSPDTRWMEPKKEVEMRKGLRGTWPVMFAVLLCTAWLGTVASSEETASEDLQARVEALAKEVRDLKDQVESLRRNVESTKLTLTAALDVMQLIRDNIGSTKDRSRDVHAVVQKLSLQVEKNRDNVELIRDCVLANWYMGYYAMQRAKGAGAAKADSKWGEYDKKSEPQFNKLQNAFQSRPSFSLGL